MASQTEICNLSLSNIAGGEIADFENESSEAARACRIYYPTALLATLRDFYWPFATRAKTLAPLPSSPNPEWAFAYRYPADCVDVKRIISGYRQDTNTSKVSFKISSDDIGLIILTDMPEAKAEYTVNNVSTERFPPDFVVAFAYRLSYYIAPRLTKGDPFKLQEKMMALYRFELGRARSNALNEAKPDEAPASEFERSR